MVNYTLLSETINDSGLRIEYIANRLGITVQAFRLKRLGMNEFTLKEITALQDVLHLDKRRFNSIFFAKDVEQHSTPGKEKETV